MAPGKRKPRADSLRNRERLIGAAKAAFTADGADVALEEIARRAGVGIGTLYRHFPDRASLVTAVYRHEVDQLAAAVDRLLADHTPGAALAAWLEQVVDYIATKRVIAPALEATAATGADAYAASRPVLYDALTRLGRAAVASGEIRADVEPDDLFRLVAGLSYGYARPDWEPSARRLIAVLIAGLRTSSS